MGLDMNNNMMHTEVGQWVSEADPKHKVGESLLNWDFAVGCVGGGPVRSRSI